MPTKAIRLPSGDQSGLAAPSGIQLELAGLTPGREVEHEKLIDGTDFAHEGEAAAVRRPFGRMIPARRARRLDRLGLEQLADDDAAAILPRLGVGPSELIGDTLAVAAQPDMIDPAKSIEVFGSDGGGHRRSPMLSAGNMLSVRAYLTAAPYRLRVKQL